MPLSVRQLDDFDYKLSGRDVVDLLDSNLLDTIDCHGMGQRSLDDQNVDVEDDSLEGKLSNLIDHCIVIDLIALLLDHKHHYHKSFEHNLVVVLPSFDPLRSFEVES